MLDREQLARFRRELNALLVTAAGDDPEAFAQAVGLVDQARAGLAIAASVLRTPSRQPNGGVVPGYSWTELAAPLGMRRQSAAERFAVRPGAPLTRHYGCEHCRDQQGRPAILPKIDCPRYVPEESNP